MQFLKIMTDMAYTGGFSKKIISGKIVFNAKHKFKSMVATISEFGISSLSLNGGFILLGSDTKY